MFIGLFLIIAVIAIIAYNSGWRPQGFTSQAAPTAASKSPLDIAKERYARGELTKEEFEQIRNDLS
jgi:putative membrane protein